eukprot:scpid92713/ scgid14540/ 
MTTAVNSLKPVLLLALVAAIPCAIHAHALHRAAHDLHVRAMRSDSDSSDSSDSASSGGASSLSEDGSSSEDTSSGNCFLTQTCMTDTNVLMTTQPDQFAALQAVFGNVIQGNFDNFVTSAMLIVADSDAGGGQGCLDGMAIEGIPLRLTSVSNLNFAVELRARDSRVLSANPGPIEFRDLFVSYVFLNLPADFGVLRIDFAVDGSGVLDGTPVPRFETASGEVFDLTLTRELCSLGQPLVCGVVEPTDPALGVPTLPANAQILQSIAVATAAEQSRCQ